MNTALQCLSNCYEVTLYFLQNKFIESINKDNPLGYKGIIAYHYSRVLKELWYGINKSFSPSQFKKIISNLHLNVRYLYNAYSVFRIFATRFPRVFVNIIGCFA
jgi:ubiquitin C-terminal hydrolase